MTEQETQEVLKHKELVAKSYLEKEFDNDLDHNKLSHDQLIILINLLKRERDCHLFNWQASEKNRKKQEEQIDNLENELGSLREFTRTEIKKARTQ
jgi:bacterioferritin (cytochrome b1)